VGTGAFVADTAPLIYRLERVGRPRLLAVCDPLFDAVERQEIGCVISAMTAAELFVKPFRSGPEFVLTVDAFLRQPFVGIADVTRDVARTGAALVAAGRVGRLTDALIASTALELGLPLVTGDRRLARAEGVNALLVADYVRG
jgi:predicted nucleic acid-binding protein